MSAWKRWQDYATMVFGVIVFISPLVFGETAHRTATLVAYVLGALLVVAGIVAAYTREPRRSLFANVPGGVVFAQQPLAGSTAHRGQSLTIWVSTGP